MCVQPEGWALLGTQVELEEMTVSLLSRDLRAGCGSLGLSPLLCVDTRMGPGVKMMWKSAADPQWTCDGSKMGASAVVIHGGFGVLISLS